MPSRKKSFLNSRLRPDWKEIRAGLQPPKTGKMSFFCLDYLYHFLASFGQVAAVSIDYSSGYVMAVIGFIRSLSRQE
jgi:hypothetical protein